MCYGLYVKAFLHDLHQGLNSTLNASWPPHEKQCRNALWCATKAILYTVITKTACKAIRLNCLQSCIYCMHQTDSLVMFGGQLQTLRNAAAAALESSVLSGADASHRKGPSDMILYQMMHLFVLFSIYFLSGPPRETQTLRKHKTQHCLHCRKRSFLTKVSLLGWNACSAFPPAVPLFCCIKRFVFPRAHYWKDWSLCLTPPCHVPTEKSHQSEQFCTAAFLALSRLKCENNDVFFLRQESVAELSYKMINNGLTVRVYSVLCSQMLCVTLLN